MAVQMVLEDVFQAPEGLIGAELAEAQRLPGLQRALDDAGAGLAVEAVGMKPDPAGRGFLEGEREGVKHLIGAKPDVLVPPQLEVGLEVVAVKLADLAVGAIASDDQVRVSELGQILDPA